MHVLTSGAFSSHVGCETINEPLLEPTDPLKHKRPGCIIAYTASSQYRQRGQVMGLGRSSICSVSSLATFCIQYTEVPHAKKWPHAQVESSLSLML